MKPLKNSKHKLEIKDVTAKGFGIAYLDEFVVFVDGALTGDFVLAHIVKVKKRYGYGKIIEIITPSPYRIKSTCPVSAFCGGCQWLHCDYSAQLGFKKQIVISALEKLGGIKNPPVFDVIGMENPFRYRNKAVFPIVPMQNRDGFAIGMYAPRSHRIISVDDCKIQHIAHIKILAVIKEQMRSFKITPYDENTHKGILRFVVIRTSLYTGEIMVVLVAKTWNETDFGNALSEKLRECGVTTLLINHNAEKGNTIINPEKFTVLYGNGFIKEKIGDIEYQLSAPSFFQVNTVQTKILYETAINQSELKHTQTVIDAHAGVGGIALFAAKHAKQVTGTDIVESAVLDAQKNAALNGITNAKFIHGAAEIMLPDILPVDVVFLDPPRKGCDPVLLDALIKTKIQKIVYVSCDPATLARDIKHLVTGGYSLITAQPVDMFPFTGKVEISVLLKRLE